MSNLKGGVGFTIKKHAIVSKKSDLSCFPLDKDIFGSFLQSYTVKAMVKLRENISENILFYIIIILITIVFYCVLFIHPHVIIAMTYLHVKRFDTPSTEHHYLLF